jgi:hypothetical protein
MKEGQKLQAETDRMKIRLDRFDMQEAAKAERYEQMSMQSQDSEGEQERKRQAELYRILKEENELL